MSLQKLSIREFLEAASGTTPFEALYAPVGYAITPPREERIQIGHLWLSDGLRAFVIFNCFVGEAPSEIEGGYPEPFYETVILSMPLERFAEIQPGPSVSYEYQWDDWKSGTAGALVERLSWKGSDVRLGAKSATIYTVRFEGRWLEYLTELELPSPEGNWLWSQASSPMSALLHRDVES
ncbi:MAG: hypothetical protein B7Y99_07855 [Caulobacterales bacterium 32-69-10]|nr:MAG: hypothetical protein B7Y99_07855 [Caulobacterales bacterium 32-69-10]